MNGASIAQLNAVVLEQLLLTLSQDRQGVGALTPAPAVRAECACRFGRAMRLSGSVRVDARRVAGTAGRRTHDARLRFAAWPLPVVELVR